MAKRPSAGVFIAGGLILGVLTAWIIMNYLREVGKSAKANWELVVMATTDIPARTEITRDMITLKEFPKEHIVEGTTNKLEAVQGRIAAVRIKNKEQVRLSDIFAKDKATGIAFKIPPGMRAITIRAGEIEAVGTAVKPGDHVDILATYHDPAAKQQTTITAFQNVTVLAINKGDTEGQGKEGATSSMTVAVTPEQAELLVAADQAGALRVALRSSGDEMTVDSPGVTIREIPRGGARRGVVEQPTGEKATPIIISPPRAQQRDMTIYKGSAKEVVPVE
jgi:pilus assembly protein CpaB